MTYLKTILPLITAATLLSISTYAGINRDSLNTVIRDLNKQSLTVTDKKIRLKVLVDLFKTYRYMSDYPNVIKTLLDGISLCDSINDDTTKADLLYYTSVAYQRLNKDDIAISYAKKAMILCEKVGDSSTLAASCHRIGLAYESKGAKITARQYLQRSLEIRIQLKNKYAIAASNNALGLTYLKENNKIANAYFLKAFNFWNELNDNEGISIAAGNIGDVYLREGNLPQAKLYLLKSYKAAKNENLLVFLRSTCASLSKIYYGSGKMDSAFYYLSEYSTSNDSLFNIESNRAVEEMQAKYEKEKKDLELNFQNKLLTKNKAELKQQETIIWGTISAGIVLIILLIYSVKAYRQKKEANENLNYQKIVIEEKHKEITDSISYAKRIQYAILPSLSSMNKLLKDCFVIYEPKDVVAGDFFWLESKGDKVYFAAADCTGHGVPGAMVSVICSNALTKALLEDNITDTGKILDRTKEIVVERFSKTEEVVQDGMDISICAFTCVNGAYTELQWSGANNPLWIIRKGEFLEYKADKQPIGKQENAKQFKTHSIKLEKNDQLYLFTDGYQDQFGGEKGKKFKSSQLKEIILSIQTSTMADQKTILSNAFYSWKGKLEQVDDVCVIGVKI